MEKQKTLDQIEMENIGIKNPPVRRCLEPLEVEPQEMFEGWNTYSPMCLDV